MLCIAEFFYSKHTVVQPIPEALYSRGFYSKHTVVVHGVIVESIQRNHLLQTSHKSSRNGMEVENG